MEKYKVTLTVEERQALDRMGGHRGQTDWRASGSDRFRIFC